jgi:uncharacterized protein (TIGR02231 family)
MAHDTEPDASVLAIDLPVVEVTLLEDRGLVRRRGRVVLPPGRMRVRIHGVAPVLVDKTAAAELTAVEGATLPPDMRVLALEVERRRVTEDAERPAELAAIRARRREKEAERDAMRASVRLAEADIASLDALADLTVAELAQDVAWGRTDLAATRSDLDRVEDESIERSRGVCELQHALARIERDLQDLLQLEAAASHESSRAVASMLVTVFNPGEREIAAELRVDYVVPGAMWRPWHTARLVEHEGRAHVHLATAGCVWQATGEDWRDVQLVFSTERPSLGVSPPTLATDRLRVRKRSAAVEVQARDQKIHTAGLGTDTAAGSGTVEDELPGIDDAGEALRLRGRARASVPGDGRPHRVPIFEQDGPAETALVCMPELAEAVILRSRQVNRAAHPLLAGPVDLVRGGGLVGRTSLLFVAPGERFEIGWGPEPALRVQRELEELPVDRRTLSSWTRRPRRIRVRLANLGASPFTIEVTERIAVSEVEKVEVELAHASRNASADDHGFVTWQVPLRGFGNEQLELQWTLVVHDDVVGL